MCGYMHTPEALVSAERIVRHKVRQQFLLVRAEVPQPPLPRRVQDVLLYEARCARAYWKRYRKCLPVWAKFPGRKTRGSDVTNLLLNLGYHHLNTHLTRILVSRSVSPALGLMHKKAKTEKSKPLVYDLMELFRADVVDREVLRYLNLKKKECTVITPHEIGKFLKRINDRLERKVYIRKFKQCHTYRYYMELQVLSFMGAVGAKEVFTPIVIPSRHESRCS